MLYESTLGTEGGKLGGGDEEVSDALDFARSRFSRRMGYGESKCVRVCIK
jgi:hypothetical protein